MTPQTVNAYYNPVMNEIVFPAAILQPPFFNQEADDAVNYGAIGAVIGHEISHAFDDQGSQYDADGNLHDWFTAADHEKFAAKTKALVAQYSAYEPVPGYHVNGELTLGENIADNSGLAIAYQAYQLSLRGKARADHRRPERRRSDSILVLRRYGAARCAKPRPSSASRPIRIRRPGCAAPPARKPAGVLCGLRRQARRQDVPGAARARDHLVGSIRVNLSTDASHASVRERARGSPAEWPWRLSS